VIPKLNLKYLARYKDLARLILRHGGPEFLRMTGLDAVIKIDDEKSQRRNAEQLAEDLEDLGPTYVKLGQLLASRADVMPVAYLEALRRLHDKVDPFPFEQVQEIIEEQLGIPLEDAYAKFDPEPLAAASIAQVHTAVLPDGTDVVVKIQRPKARETIESDLQAFEHLAWFLDEYTELGKRYQFKTMFRQMSRALRTELDYDHEAESTRLVGDNLEEFERLVVPRPIDSHSSPVVLTMTRIFGRSLSDFSGEDDVVPDANALADEFLHAYLKQVLEDGVFHADPHPGNLIVTDDGRLAIIDLGVVGRISSGIQESILRLLVAIADGRSEDAADAGEELGDRTARFDGSAYRAAVRDAITHGYSNSVGQMNLGQLVLNVTQAASDAGLMIAPEVMLLGKTLAHLDESGKRLAPNFDTNAALREHVSKFLKLKLANSISMGRAMVNALEAKAFLNSLPNRVSKALAIIADNAFRVKVDALDENRLIRVIEKVANRVSVGLIATGVILGGAVMMGHDSPHQLFGYPVVALILLSVGILAGSIVVLLVLWNDFFKGT